MKTTITTVIPTYNGAAHLAETLESLAAQARRPDRVVAVDDGSTDSTEYVARGFEKLAVEWRPHSCAGSLANHNRGLALAEETTFLHFLHQDDLVHPAFYAAVLEAHRIEGVTGGRTLTYCVPERTERPDASTFGDWWNESYQAVAAEDFVWERARLGVINPSSVVLRTDNRLAPCVFDGRFRCVGDQLFMALWADQCECVLRLEDGLCQYRVNPDGDTAALVRAAEPWVLDELPAMRLMAGLVPAEPWTRWKRRQLLRALFVARSAGKVRDHPRMAWAVARLTARALWEDMA